MLNDANTSMNELDNNYADIAPEEDQYEAMYKGMHKYSEYEGMELARAYVPFQKLNTIYPPEQCLLMGTCFPELSRPYHGKGHYQCKPIFKI